jgi:hypothetical protein
MDKLAQMQQKKVATRLKGETLKKFEKDCSNKYWSAARLVEHIITKYYEQREI